MLLIETCGFEGLKTSYSAYHTVAFATLSYGRSLSYAHYTLHIATDSYSFRFLAHFPMAGCSLLIIL